MKLECKNDGLELLLDPNDCHEFKMSNYPMYGEFVAPSIQGGLIFPSHAVLRVVKAIKVIYSCWIKNQVKGSTGEWHSGLKIEIAVLEQLGLVVFNVSPAHFFEHCLSVEADLFSFFQSYNSEIPKHQSESLWNQVQW